MRNVIRLCALRKDSLLLRESLSFSIQEALLARVYFIRLLPLFTYLVQVTQLVSATGLKCSLQLTIEMLTVKCDRILEPLWIHIWFYILQFKTKRLTVIEGAGHFIKDNWPSPAKSPPLSRGIMGGEVWMPDLYHRRSTIRKTALWRSHIKCL